MPQPTTPLNEQHDRNHRDWQITHQKLVQMGLRSSTESLLPNPIVSSDQPQILNPHRKRTHWIINDHEVIYAEFIDHTVRDETANLLDRGCHLVTLDNRLNTLQYPEEIVKLIIAVLGYGAEMNLKDINRRCKEGAELYRAKGNHWGRKHSYTTDQAKHVMAMRSEGLGYGTIARSMGMTKSMVRRIIERFQDKQ